MTAIVPAMAPKLRFMISKRGFFLSGRNLCRSKSKDAILITMNGMMPTTEANNPLNKPRVPSFTYIPLPQFQMPSLFPPGVLT